MLCKYGVYLLLIYSQLKVGLFLYHIEPKAFCALALLKRQEFQGSQLPIMMY